MNERQNFRLFGNRDVWLADRYCKKNPAVSVVGGLLVIVYAIPISLFLAFAIVSFLLTFAGFLIIEGAVMIVAFIILVSALSTLTAFVILTSLAGWLLYVTTSQLYVAANVNVTPKMSSSPKIRNNSPMHSFERHEE